MADCAVHDCIAAPVQRLTVALEVREWSPKVTLDVCRRHGNAMDEKPGRYLVTESHPIRSMDSV